MAFYGVGLDVAVKKTIFDFQTLLKRKADIGIRELVNALHSFDFHHTKKLSIKEFEGALGVAGLFPKIVKLQALVKFYDRDNDGCIYYEDFIRAIR